LCPEENFARWRQRQRLKDMSAESEKDVAKETEKRNTVRYSVMGGKNEFAVRLLMEHHSTEERSLIGVKGAFTSSAISRCHRAKADVTTRSGMHWPGTWRKCGTRLKVVSMQAESSG
jgi:hypothetical protein